jgi:hypothetical protein
MKYAEFNKVCCNLERTLSVVLTKPTPPRVLVRVCRHLSQISRWRKKIVASTWCKQGTARNQCHACLAAKGAWYEYWAFAMYIGLSLDVHWDLARNAFTSPSQYRWRLQLPVTTQQYPLFLINYKILLTSKNDDAAVSPAMALLLRHDA